jgi:cytochrome c oxidase subunit 3
MAEVYATMSSRVAPDAVNKRAHHFSTLAKQRHAATLGMWVFLGTEVLLFGGLFVAYAYYRVVFPETFGEASAHLDIGIGTINTLILILSSFAVALSTYFVYHTRIRLAAGMLGIAMACGFAFLTLKGFEWSAHFREGAYPGKYYAFEAVQGPGASLFFSLYYLMTGLHALHVTIGIGALGWALALTLRGAFSRDYDTPLELVTMYWHLVDIIWIFLFPALYVI